MRRDLFGIEVPSYTCISSIQYPSNYRFCLVMLATAYPLKAIDVVPAIAAPAVRCQADGDEQQQQNDQQFHYIFLSDNLCPTLKACMA